MKHVTNCTFINEKVTLWVGRYDKCEEKRRLDMRVKDRPEESSKKKKKKLKQRKLINLVYMESNLHVSVVRFFFLSFSFLFCFAFSFL